MEAAEMGVLSILDEEASKVTDLLLTTESAADGSSPPVATRLLPSSFLFAFAQAARRPWAGVRYIYGAPKLRLSTVVVASPVSL